VADLAAETGRDGATASDGPSASHIPARLQTSHPTSVSGGGTHNELVVDALSGMHQVLPGNRADPQAEKSTMEPGADPADDWRSRLRHRAYPEVVDRRGRGGWAAGIVLVALVLTTLLTACGGEGSAGALSTIPTRPASLTTTTVSPSGPSLSSSSQVHATVTVLTHLPTRSFAILRSGAASRDQPIGLYVTSGFVDFTPITPPIDTLTNGTEFASGRDVMSASFPTIDDGWVTETTGGGGAGVLLHTTDGGASWEANQQLPGGPSPISYVSFVSSEDGWLVKGERGCAGTCGPNVYRTTNGGVTWQHLLTVHDLFELSTTSDPLPTFANSMDGIATTRPKVIASPVTASKASLRKHEEPAPSIRRGVTRLTTDGGSTWRKITVPVAGKGVPIYQRPVFFATGRRGVMPSLVIHQTGKESDPVTVDFFRDLRQWYALACRPHLRIPCEGGYYAVLPIPDQHAIGVGCQPEGLVGHGSEALG